MRVLLSWLDVALIFVWKNLNLPERAKTCQGMENILEIVKAAPSKFGHGVGHRVQGWAKVGKFGNSHTFIMPWQVLANYKARKVLS